MPSNSSPQLSSPSLVSVTTTSSATSTTPLQQSSPPSKDYSAAFGQLQSQYGWGGPVRAPVKTLPRTKEKKERREVAGGSGYASGSNLKTTAPSTAPAPARLKDKESAFGLLASRMGLGGKSPKPSQGQSKSREGDNAQSP